MKVVSSVHVRLPQHVQDPSWKTWTTKQHSQVKYWWRIEFNFFLLVGLVVGCLPVHGLRLSTLECFYSSKCLTELAEFVNSSLVLSPLNRSIPSRFTPISSTPIGTLIDELFIESWQNSSNYSSYYSICAPLNCRYTYVERNGFVYMLTTILGLYGGLTEGLPIVIWGSLHVYWKIRERIKRHRRIVPIDSDWRVWYLFRILWLESEMT